MKNTEVEKIHYWSAFVGQLGRSKNRRSHIVLKLLYSNCVPILTYASEIRTHSSREMMNMDIALNNSIRKIFMYNQWESTQGLRKSYGYSSITDFCETPNILYVQFT